MSWRILREDLESAYKQALLGQAVQLPERTTEYQDWSASLSALAKSGEFTSERAHWLDVSAEPLLQLPDARDASVANTVANSRTFTVSLNERETSDLLQRVPAAYATQANDVLIAALSEALGRWAGNGSLLLDLEGHGREDLGTHTDLTRTVGWFTSIFPVRLDLATEATVGDRIKATKQRLRSIPRRGVGYGNLKYLADDRELRARPQAQVLFNYLGQFDQLVADSTLLKFAAESEGAWVAPTSVRSIPAGSERAGDERPT